jgi:parallel beta-helix repeat protein
VRETRDGIYIDTSNGNLLQGNTLQDLRYGIHYMFSNDNRVLGNTTRRTRTGYALMQSRQLTVTGNRSEQDQNYGILMNYITYSTLQDNVVTDVRDGSTGDTMIAGGGGPQPRNTDGQHREQQADRQQPTVAQAVAELFARHVPDRAHNAASCAVIWWLFM